MTSGAVGAAIGGLIGALIGAGAGLWSASITAEASRYTSDVQVEAERKKEDREKIADVYNAYLDAAVKYNIASDNYAFARAIPNAIESLKKLSPPTAPADATHSTSAVGGALLDERTMALKRMRDETAAAFELAINNLAVYGSAAAWEIHKELVPVLANPNSGTNVEITLVDQARFNELIARFRLVFCDSVALEKTYCSARAQQGQS